MSNDSDHDHVADSDCLEAIDHIYAYINGELKDEVELAKIEHHLGHCKSCFSRAQIERELNKRIKDSGKDKTPETLQKRLRSLMDDL
jgi:anti-sigma factor (TIGR02949 family)